MLPLSIVERQACYYVFSEPAAICQNMFLATEALGLGGWKHCGFLSLEILKRMGFRIVAANGGATFGNPVGLDGVGRNTAWHFSGMWIFVLNGLAVDVVHPQRERFANS